MGSQIPVGSSNQILLWWRDIVFPRTWHNNCSNSLYLSGQTGSGRGHAWSMNWPKLIKHVFQRNRLNSAKICKFFISCDMIMICIFCGLRYSIWTDKCLWKSNHVYPGCQRFFVCARFLVLIKFFFVTPKWKNYMIYELTLKKISHVLGSRPLQTLQEHSPRC